MSEIGSTVQSVATIGPACEKEEILEHLVLCGMDIARVNFSHATHPQFTAIKKLLDTFEKKHGKRVYTMMDLQGPRMRVGELPKNGLTLEDGQSIVFSTNAEEKDAIHINDPYLHEDIEVGEPMFLANGELELSITQVKGTRITAKVIRGGVLYSRKGINLPDTNLTTRGITEKDIKDIEFGIKIGVDYIALSFVKDAQDVLRLREMLGDFPIKIISKIERKLAILNLDEIIKASDAIMVARGDLGIEVPLEEVPPMQKEMIKRALNLGKPSIVATQMLMSMVNHPRPTRAEVSDVANAVLDGAQYVMLSDETAFGKYPVESLRYLIRIAQRAKQFQQNPTVFL